MLGVSRPIYVNVDSPNLGFPYFNFLGGYPVCQTIYEQGSWVPFVPIEPLEPFKGNVIPKAKLVQLLSVWLTTQNSDKYQVW